MRDIQLFTLISGGVYAGLGLYDTMQFVGRIIYHMHRCCGRYGCGFNGVPALQVNARF